MVLGIALAGIFARRDRQPELLPLLPPASVLLLGIYLHDIQMLLALPPPSFSHHAYAAKRFARSPQPGALS